MVTSNKLPEKKVVKMSEQNNSVVVPQRTLLGEVNEHLTCPICRGYYIDATTIVECLHSFCRSCIIKHLQVKSYCPVCEMMINSAKPNIKLDKALQDIVYKLVPGLFQKEMNRRQAFYASRPGSAACATPEQRGEETRLIWAPDDVISFSLEYADATDTDSISSKSSDSNDAQTTGTQRRYLQCPAVVNISHLKKFLSMKFDIDSTQFAIDILYKRVPMPDYYTLMDIAYIYNYKRNEPMRLFYQIIDYLDIRNRLFDASRKGSHFRERKSSPATTEETNVSSPAPINEQGSEASSGTDSPMPDDNSKDIQKFDKPVSTDDGTSSKKSTSKKGDDEVEKSEFLNSFELKAKSDLALSKSSPTKVNPYENLAAGSASQKNRSHPEDPLKRKQPPPPLCAPDTKKSKIESEKNKLPDFGVKSFSSIPEETSKASTAPEKHKETDTTLKTTPVPTATKSSSAIPTTPKDMKPLQPTVKRHTPESPVSKRPIPTPPESPVCKRPIPAPQSIPSPKRKNPNEPNSSAQVQSPQRTVTPLKLHLPKFEAPASVFKSDSPKSTLKKMPELKPTTPQSAQIKNLPVNKLRMDLLANNSDPTIDRSKILSQVKSSLGVLSPGHASGDPLKSLFDSCKINIPSSLSITLTDQKQDPRNPAEAVAAEPKNQAVVNKNLANASNSSPSAHKVPSPPVHNYIEILKLPDADPRKQMAPDVTPDSKQNAPVTPEGLPVPQKPVKSSETSAKGPIPNLKPISDTKLAKQAAVSANAGGPITFQQTFEQQLQTLQTDKKPKLPKTKAQVPKLVPATPKAFSAAKLSSPTTNSTPNPVGIISALESKASAALDLSTPHPLQSQLSPHQTKAFETMQSIANLAKKQDLPQKGSQSSSQNYTSNAGRPLNQGANPLRVPPGHVSQMKPQKLNPAGLPGSSLKQDMGMKSNQSKSMPPSSNLQSPSYPIALHNPPSTAQPQPSPRQTRSPSSSPKLVIAEEKQVGNPMEQTTNQPNQITSSGSQMASGIAPKSEPHKASPGPSKPTIKPLKPPIPAASKVIPPPMPKPNPPTDFQLISAHQALLRHQMEMSAWIKAQRQFDLYKNMTNMAHHTQNDFNKDKQ